MLAKCEFDPDVKIFENSFESFRRRKPIWKYCLHNGGRIVSAWMRWYFLTGLFVTSIFLMPCHPITYTFYHHCSRLYVAQRWPHDTERSLFYRRHFRILVWNGYVLNWVLLEFLQRIQSAMQKKWRRTGDKQLNKLMTNQCTGADVRHTTSMKNVPIVVPEYGTYMWSRKS